MIIAGEASGDMHGAALVKELSARMAGTRFIGIGGPAMREAGMQTSHDIAEMAVMGFVEVLKHYSFFKRVFLEMEEMARHEKPDAVILIDYPGFNLRFAEKTHAMGLKTIYYICPQVWAWHRSRIPQMARLIDRLITIFPFEKQHFEGTGLKVDFVGHPLVDIVQEELSKSAPALPWKGQPRLALLPGSRRQEIERILPAMWGAAGILQTGHPDISCIVAAPSEESAVFIRGLVGSLGGGPAKWEVIAGMTRQVVRQAAAALVASGTATVETALMGCPLVVTYKMAPLSYLFARSVIQVDHIGMVNIIAGRRLCPELVQGAATPRALAEAVTPMLSDTPERRAVLAGLAEVKSRLGSGGASSRAAALIAESMGQS